MIMLTLKRYLVDLYVSNSFNIIEKRTRFTCRVHSCVLHGLRKKSDHSQQHGPAGLCGGDSVLVCSSFEFKSVFRSWIAINSDHFAV